MNPPHSNPNNPSAQSGNRRSWRLVLLTGVVLLAHWAVLRAAPTAFAAHESAGPVQASWAFSSRTISPDSPAVPAERAAKERTTPPPPARATVRAVAVAPAVLPESYTSNSPPALVEYGDTAINTIANIAAPDIPPPDVPVILAQAQANGTRAASAKPLPAKAVRGFVIPLAARLKYDITGEVKGFPYQVNGELRWAPDGKTYAARMEISHFLLGSRVQTSTGHLTRFGLEPTRFGDKVRSEVAAHFDYEKSKVTFSANTPDSPLLPGAQDQLSVFMQMAAMFGADPKGFPPGSTLPFQAVGPRSADSWVFNVGAVEKLQMPGGDISAVRLWRDPNGEHDAKGEIWLAPELGYLPVRIRLTQPNGDFVDQQWRETLK
jgi:hypothetical protein